MIVLDTHIVIWLAESPELLSSVATEAIKVERRDGVLAISDMSLLELARLIFSRRLEVRTPLSMFLQRIEQSFKVLPVTSAIAEQAMLFSSDYPRDLVDRVIGATAVTHGCRLITKDRGIRQSKEVDCVW